MIFDCAVFPRRRTVEGSRDCRFDNLSRTFRLSLIVPMFLFLSGDLKLWLIIIYILMLVYIVANTMLYFFLFIKTSPRPGKPNQTTSFQLISTPVSKLFFCLMSEPLTGNYLLPYYVTFSLIWQVSLEVASVDKTFDSGERTLLLPSWFRAVTLMPA